LGKCFLIHVVIKVDLVGSLHASEITGQARATPNKLEVHLALIVVKGRQHAPEALDERRVFRSATEARNRLQLVNVDGFLATGASFDLLPVHDLQH